MENAKSPSFIFLFRYILQPESRFYWLMLIYGIGVSALTLSVPLSVQVLIGSVVNSALAQQVYVLSVVLLCLLCLSGLFFALQVYLMELFERRFFSRVVSEVSLRLIYAEQPYMERINRDELVNRYFDIMSVQKSLPPLLTGALATLLQAIVGIAVTSFYHPVFILFNVAVLLIAYLIFRIFDAGASNSALALSAVKYNTAQWLESLARSNSFFKSRRTIDYALARTSSARAAYIAEHRRHFRYTFAQIVGFLLLYATASAALLGVGGLLVIEGQLTIGQLVAAELIFSAIFYGLTRIGYYLELYYDLYAAMNKLLQLYTLEPEEVRQSVRFDQWSPVIRFEHVEVELRGGNFIVNLEFAAGCTALIETRSSTQITAIVDLLRNFTRPKAGKVLLGGHEVDDFNVHDLRNDVLVIDSVAFPECLISEYLTIAAPSITRAQMREIMEIVGLTSELAGVTENLDVMLTPYGYPLSDAGVIKLKIAFAIAAQPKILVLTPLFDMLSPESRAAIMQYLAGRADISVLCFSHRRDLPLFDDFVFCDFNAQQRFDSAAEMAASYQHIPGLARANRSGPAQTNADGAAL